MIPPKPNGTDEPPDKPPARPPRRIHTGYPASCRRLALGLHANDSLSDTCFRLRVVLNSRFFWILLIFRIATESLEGTRRSTQVQAEQQDSTILGQGSSYGVKVKPFPNFPLDASKFCCPRRNSLLGYAQQLGWCAEDVPEVTIIRTMPQAAVGNRNEILVSTTRGHDHRSVGTRAPGTRAGDTGASPRGDWTRSELSEEPAEHCARRMARTPHATGRGLGTLHARSARIRGKSRFSGC